MSSFDPRAAAAELVSQHERRLPLTPLSSPPPSLDDAYRAQDSFLALRSGGDARSIAGWKIALTTPVMQSFVGIHHPLAGAILRPRVHRSGALLRADDYVHLGVESELAVRIARDAADRGEAYDRDGIADYVAACMAATEVVDDRACDYEKLDPHLLIADNAFNQGCVLGPEQPEWRALDLAAARGEMRINGEPAGRGVGADVLGHPLEALAWLANHLIGRGRHLRAGDVVLTGSIVATKWLAPGDAMVTEIEGLGAAELRVR